MAGVQRSKSHLPWFIGVIAFIFYAATLAHGLTINNLPLVAKITGADTNPWLGHPLLWLLTLPLRLMSATSAATGLNLFSAGCAAATLALIFRSVQLLPQNRLPVQRIFFNRRNGIFSAR